MKNTIMMQTPILRNQKKIEIRKNQSFDNLLEEKLFVIPLSPEKKECQKKPEKPRGYKSLHSSEFVELTQLNPK
jgi:hypothetical protein